MAGLDINVLRGVGTLFAMLAFLGIVFWACDRNRRAAFDDAARLPLEEDAIDPAGRQP
jgi:cytochrome c oxidase cbb3-type subunit IV